MLYIKDLRLKQILCLMLLPVFVLGTACSDDDDATETNADIAIEQIYDRVTTGTWRITLYNDSGVDETSDYTDYTFTFEPDGKLLADNGMEAYAGIWSMTKDDDSSDDSSNDDNDIDFNISFSTPEVLVELTDDWDVNSWSDNRLELFDVSGGDGTTDLLTFEKN